MPTRDKQHRDQDTNPLFSNCNETRIHASAGRKSVSCTVKDVARLAGVSTATVSRVANGAGNVSGNARTKVLAAISKLKYCPNANAAELGRANAGIRRDRGLHVSALTRREGRADFQSGTACAGSGESDGRIVVTGRRNISDDES